MTESARVASRTISSGDKVSVEQFHQHIADSITESEFRDQVVQEARRTGWAAWFVWNSKHSPKGWLDLELARPPRFIKAELKKKGGVLTREQRETMDLLRQYPWIEVYAWWPRDMDAIRDILK